MMRTVKLGGRTQRDARLPMLLADAWHDAPGTLCVVHGGGDAVSALQRACGVEPSFAGGRRITSADDIDHVRMALSGAANKQLVSRLVAAGAPAVGLSGEDAALLGAHPVDDAALGRVGVPSVVNRALLRHLLTGGYLPVISPLARDLNDATGAALNVNGDDAAAAIAVALRADELVMVVDVGGVLGADGTLEQTLTLDDAALMIASGVARGGMIAKLAAAVAAIRGGVPQVRIADVEGLRDPSRGTLIAASAGSLA